MATNVNVYNQHIEGRKILIVDDVEINRFILVQQLNKVGCNSTLAKNGIEALKLIKENYYDLIIMDIQMPLMDGHKTTQLIRSEVEPPMRDVPILVVSAGALKEEIKKALESGANDYIVKPYSEINLFDKISLLLNTPLKNMNSSVSLLIDGQPFEYIVPEQIFRNLDFDKESILDIVLRVINNLSTVVDELNLHLGKEDWAKINQLSHKFTATLPYGGIELLLKDSLAIESLSNELQYTESINNIALITSMINKVTIHCQGAIPELRTLIQLIS